MAKAKKAPVTTEKKQAATTWKPGQSGNPAGRPKGSRHKLSESFVKALLEDFEANGVAAIKKVRNEDPSSYLKTIANIVPKTFDLEDAAEAGGFTIQIVRFGDADGA